MEEKELTNEEKIITLEEKEIYKYLEILEMDTIKQEKMKEKHKKVSQEDKNLIKESNTLTVPFVR